MKTQTMPRREGWFARVLPGGIRARLFLLIALVLLPLMLLLGWIFHQRYEVRRAEQLQTEVEVARGVATIFEAFVNDIRRQSYAVGQAIVASPLYSQAKATRLLTAAAAQYRTVYDLSWVSPGGVVLASSLPAGTGRDLSLDRAFQEVAAGRPWAIGDLSGSPGEAPTVRLATAIPNDGGTLRGLIVATIDTARLGELTGNQRRPAGSAYAIFDRQGVLVFDSTAASLPSEERLRLREIDPVLQRALQTGLAQSDVTRLAIPGGKWLVARVPIADIGWVAGARRPVEIALAPVRRALLQDASLAALAAALAFLLAYLLARTIAGPLRGLERDAAGMGAGEIGMHHDDPIAPTEVRHLRSTVAAMARELIRHSEALRESETRFKAIFNGISDAAVFADTERRIRLINPAFTTMFGYSSEECLGRTTEFLYADPTDYREQGRRRYHPEGEPETATFQSRYRRKDGSEFWSESLGVRIAGPDGAVLGYLGLHRDITERKRTEEALREQEERLRLFIEHAPAALAMFDREMRYITASRRWRKDYGLGERDIRGLSHYEVFPEIPERWREIHRRALTGEVLRADEERFDRAGGSTQWIRWEIRPWHDAAGAVAGILIFSEDITARRAAEESLRASEERLRQGVRVAGIGIFEHDHRTEAIHASPEMRDISGWEEPVTLETILERVYPEDRERVAAAIRKAHDPAGDGMFSVEHRIVRPDGSIRHVSVRSRTFFEGEGAARRPLRTIGAAMDTTERQRMEQAMLSAKEAAEEANRVKNEFLANMSHELRTPLTVIMASLEMLRDPSSDPAPFVQMAESSAQRLLGTIDDLLDITRIEARRLEIENRPFDLRDCVRHATERFAAAAREKRLRLHWEVAPQVPAEVVGDPDRVAQVLGNLVGNAVKFTDEGGVTVSVAVREGAVEFTVRDTGIGIPAKKMERLFQPFMQVDSSLTRRFGGTGLGLAICQKLAQMMGGTIRVESEPGRGSTFTLTLPLRPTVPAVHAPRLSELVVGEVERPGRVLVAEDDPMIRGLVETILRRHGWDVAISENGREAVARWKEGGIDLVLMDLQMPEMDGLTATRAIRALESGGAGRTPIIALTAHVRPEDREECLEAGMDGFLSKPIRMGELYAVVDSCLHGGCTAARATRSLPDRMTAEHGRGSDEPREAGSE